MMLALLAKELGFFWIGLLYACRWLTLNLLEIPSGAVADHWGRRKCMIASFVAYTLSFLTFAWAMEFTWLVCAMVLFGIGDSFRTGTHKAMIFHWLKVQGRQDERTKIYGLTRSWSKYGSAVSALVAGGLLLVTRDYQSVFLFAAIPSALNIINFMGYPRELDSERMVTGVAAPGGMNAIFVQPMRVLRNALANIRDRLELRRLLLESVAWEGVFHAVKDYLQPALLMFVLTVFLATPMTPEDLKLSAAQGPADALTIVVIAVVYCLLFVLSARTSRGAHRWVEKSGDADKAAQRLWWRTFGLYACILCGCLAGWQLMVIVGLVALIVTQNLWRPILIGRIDEHGESSHAATLLSLESQSQRLATMALAPLVGLAIDWTASRIDAVESSTANAYSSLALWPVGALGLASATFILILYRKRSSQGLLPS